MDGERLREERCPACSEDLPAALCWSMWPNENRTTGRSLLLFRGGVNLGGDFQSQSVQANEPGGVVLVVGLGWVGLHGGDVRIVKTDRGFATGVDDVSLVKLHAHGAANVLLAFGDEGLQSKAL